MKEIWKDVLGYEGLYQVSNYGRLKCLNKIRVGFSYKNGKTTNRFYPEKLMKLSKFDRYYGAGLRKNGKYKTMLIHRLVAIAFIENPLNKPNINHIDFNTKNNTIHNIEWCTQYENIHHTMSNGRNRQMKGEDNGHAKFKNFQIPEIKRMRSSGLTQKQISEYYGVHQVTICKILTGKTYNI